MPSAMPRPMVSSPLSSDHCLSMRAHHDQMFVLSMLQLHRSDCSWHSMLYHRQHLQGSQGVMQASTKNILIVPQTLPHFRECSLVACGRARPLCGLASPLPVQTPHP
jgi:hypothetical protein